ncbi:hypothetical protein quinque_015817 [Culex quinquefasciatus]
MARVGLWGPRFRVYRFWALFTFGTMVILFPKTVLGIGSDDVTAICKGLAELNFEASIYIPMAIFALKRDAFERVVQGWTRFFREVSFGEESKDCYNMIREQNYNSLCYRLVAEKIRKLPQPTDDGSTKVNIGDLKKLVEVHRKAYNVTILIEDICQVPLALEFLTCVIFWCLSMIYISKKIDFNLINVMIIFCLSLIETFGCSFLGSELAEEAEAVGKAIYDLPWYEHSVELQRFYRLIIQRTQRPTGITGVKLFVVQRTTFASVIQMSYSYYLVLQDVLNNF